MRVTQSMVDRSVIFGIARNHGQLNRLHQQLSTGQKVNVVSDDVSAARQIMNLNRENDEISALLRNLGRAGDMLSVGSASMMQVSDSLSRVKELSVQAATGTYTDTDRAAMAAEVDSLLESIVGGVNVQHQGEYVFAGRATDTKPFQADRDPSGEITSVEYQGGATATEVRIGPRQSADTNLVGRRIVTEDMFQTVVSLRDAIRAGDESAIRQLMDGLEVAHTKVRKGLGRLGARQQRLEMVRNTAESYRDLNEDIISEHQDADIAEVSVKYNSQMVLLQTLLKTASQALRPSMGNFL